MPRYPKSAVTAKRGINHVRSVVEDAGSLFIKIEQENDLGIDALIELIQDGRPLDQQIAVQVKSGQSYYNTDAGECLFPIGKHREYWSKHRLAVPTPNKKNCGLDFNIRAAQLNHQSVSQGAVLVHRSRS